MPVLKWGKADLKFNEEHHKPNGQPEVQNVQIFRETAVFTARRYAKRGICRRRVSVCLSVCVCVCHTPVLYQNG